MTPDEFLEQAQCRGAGPDIFYPVHKSNGRGGRTVTDDELWAPARAICWTCPIRQACLDAHRHERYGMWGGTTPAERGYGATDGRTHIDVGQQAFELVANKVRALGHRRFTSQMLSEWLAGQITPRSVGRALKLLVDVGALQIVGADGKAHIYQAAVAQQVAA